MLLGSFTVQAQAGKDFEGHIRMNMRFDTEGMDASMLDNLPIPKGFDYYFKNGNSRVVMDGKSLPISTILILKDGKGAKSYILDAARKKALVMDTPKEEAAKKDEKAKVEKTTQIKKVNGYNCTLYKVAYQDANSGMMINQEVWATTEINVKRPNTNPNEAYWEKVDGFPMMMTMDMGMFKMAMETVKVEPGTQPADLFVVPKDYKTEPFDASKLNVGGKGKLDAE